MESGVCANTSGKLRDDVTKPDDIKLRVKLGQVEVRQSDGDDASVTRRQHLHVTTQRKTAPNIVLDASGKPVLREKSPTTGQNRGGKMLTRKGTPAQLPKMEKILGEPKISSVFTRSSQRCSR